MRYFTGALCSLAVMVSCCEPKKSLQRFEDPVRAKIAEYQDRRYSDSLYQFFKSDLVQYRYDAVIAFASIQDTLAIDALREVLFHDKELFVRKAAAISLG